MISDHSHVYLTARDFPK
nr:unnamed protein product [Callosobruchus chinensis]